MSVIINNKKFPAEYLSTSEEKMKGMMGRDSLEGCMVFKMGMGHHSFWMKDCLIPLDIVFVNKNTISKIHSNCQPCDGNCTQKYTGLGDHVIEFPAGVAGDFKVGDRVNMYLGTPQNPVR
jgi:uncharacterized membrane protein (UPF0127 family)